MALPNHGDTSQLDKFMDEIESHITQLRHDEAEYLSSGDAAAAALQSNRERRERLRDHLLETYKFIKEWMEDHPEDFDRDQQRECQAIVTRLVDLAVVAHPGVLGQLPYAFEDKKLWRTCRRLVARSLVRLLETVREE